MAKGVYENVRIFAGGADLTSASSKVAFKSKVETEDVTNFASGGAREYLPGLWVTSAEASGQWEAGSAALVDDNRWAATGGTNAWSIFPSLNESQAASAGVGDVCYFSSFVDTEYTLLGQVDKYAPWSATAQGTWPSVRGVGLHPPGTARTANGSGTATQNVATGAAQYLYANLHVLSVAGTSTPTITVIVQSDATNSFSGAETTRLSFTAATAIGGQSIRVGGPITDTWFRAKWTISGTSPSFLFVVTLGVK